MMKIAIIGAIVVKMDEHGIILPYKLIKILYIALVAPDFQWIYVLGKEFSKGIRIKLILSWYRLERSKNHQIHSF